jgi:outer membrane protein OmpA-like peptidoglycan-associated protein
METFVKVKRFFIVPAVLSMVIGTGIIKPADAYNEPLTVNRFGQRGLLQLYSPHTLGSGTMVLGIYGDGSLDQNFLKGSKAWDWFTTSFDTTVGQKPSISTFNINPFIGLGLADFFDVSLMLPIHMDMIGMYQEVGMGDLQLTLKLGTHSGSRTPVFDVGFLGAFIVPTGSNETGVFPRHAFYFNKNSLAADTAVVGAYYSSQRVDFESHLLMSLDLGALKRAVPLALFIDYGMLFTTRTTSDDAVLMSAALEYRPVNALGLVVEFNSEMRYDNFSHSFALNKDPLHIVPEIVFTPSNGLMLTLGSEISLVAPSSSYTYVKERDAVTRELLTTGIEPKWRAFIQIGWNGVVAERDRDHDGIPDRYDQCPDVPEDVDGFQDDDGCPDYDNDNDGIPDSLDKCPNKAEDKDGFQDEDGCPDYDNDQDGIADSVDKCPNFREDYDGVEDKDGCPDYDNDRDGVRDSFDHCPNVPEDIDGFQDNDGCPDVDNDQDGVPDTVDKCPDQAGPAENNGCPVIEQPKPVPKTKEIKRGRVLLRGVTFEKGTAVIEHSSFPVLDEVAASLSDWPQMQIEIQGHTDNQGSALHKLELSRDRAEAVRNYLINKGISSSRLTTVGKSDSSPLGDNATKAGRTVNNRIELRRIDP